MAEKMFCTRVSAIGWKIAPIARHSMWRQRLNKTFRCFSDIIRGKMSNADFDCKWINKFDFIPFKYNDCRNRSGDGSHRIFTIKLKFFHEIKSFTISLLLCFASVAFVCLRLLLLAACCCSFPRVWLVTKYYEMFECRKTKIIRFFSRKKKNNSKITKRF